MLHCLMRMKYNEAGVCPGNTQAYMRRCASGVTNELATLLTLGIFNTLPVNCIVITSMVMRL
jgi:hypothetical protein